ncbi:MAG: hypothetical protein ACYC1D_09290 [Acidimicrobiales bacterium]
MRLASPWARPVLASALVAVVLVGQAVGTRIYGDLRTPSRVNLQLARQGSADLAVVMDFTPEEFNLNYLQAKGNIVRTSGDTVYLNGVTAPAAQAIAGQYWVAAVRPWGGGAR